MALQIKVIDSLDEIQSVRDQWTQMRPNPHADIDYYSMIVRLRPEVIQPYVILVSNNRTLQAMVVGRIEWAKVDLRIGYWSVYRPRLKTLVILYEGVLGEQTAEIAETVVSRLTVLLRQRHIDAVLLSYLRKDSQLFDLVSRKLSFFCRDHVVQLQPHWRLFLPPDPDKIYSRLSRNSRQQLRRKAKHLHEAFPRGIAVRCFRKPDELEKMISDVEQVAGKTYQRGLGVGFLNNPETKTRLAFEAEHGWLYTYVLYLQGKPCAYWWGVVLAGTFHSCAMGFDARYSQYSPGSYLLAQTLEDLCRQGVKQVDFGVGDARYKQQFASEHFLEASVFMFAPTIRAAGLNAVRTLNENLMGLTKRALRRVNATDAVKRRWRRRLAPLE